MSNSTLLEALKKQVVPALGCTEPVSVAIAASAAFLPVKGEVREINITTSLNVYKNGMKVGIPGTKETGIAFAGALAVICGNPDLQLEVFRGVNDEYERKAKALVDKGIVTVSATSDSGDFFVHAEIKTDAGVGECTIRESHANIVDIRKNGESISGQAGSRAAAPSSDAIPSIRELLRFSETVDASELRFLMDGVAMNLDIADTGAGRKYCSGLGNKLHALIRGGQLPDDLPNRIRATAASACDARMAGAKKPVMSSAGSGNHGITAILPVAIVARELKKTDEELTRALAVSHLTTAFIKQHIGKLSPICGCAVAAGSGAAAGIAWLLGGRDETTVGNAINNMIGSLAGMLCDGAKGSCSFKVAAAASESYYQALSAYHGAFIEPCDGLIGNTATESIQNMAIISRTAMQNVDRSLVEIISSR